MNDSELIKLQKQAVCYGIYRGLSKEEAQDFSMFSVIQGIGRKNPILKFLFIDYLRKITAWERGKEVYEQEQKKISYCNYRYDEKTNGGISGNVANESAIAFDKNKYDPKIYETLEGLPDHYLQGLNEEEKKHIVLRFVDGWTGDEIGEYFGLSESRMCQKFKVLKEKIKKNMIKTRQVILEIRKCACGCGREFRCYPNSPQKFSSRECKIPIKQITKTIEKRSEPVKKKLSKIVPREDREKIIRAANQLRDEGYRWGTALEKKLFEMGYKKPNGGRIGYASIYAWEHPQKAKQRTIKPTKRSTSALKEKIKKAVIAVRESANELDFIKFITASKLPKSKKMAIIKILVS